MPQIARPNYRIMKTIFYVRGVLGLIMFLSKVKAKFDQAVYSGYWSTSILRDNFKNRYFYDLLVFFWLGCAVFQNIFDHY